MNTKEGRRLAEGRGNGGARLRTDIYTPSVQYGLPVESSPSASRDADVAHVIAETAKLLYTVSETAALLSLSRAHVYRLLKRGELTSVRIGRSRRVSAADLAAYIEWVCAATAEGEDYTSWY